MDSTGSFFDVVGFDELGGRDDLTCVALGVVGEMSKQSSHAGWKLLFTYAARLLEVRCSEGADAPAAEVSPALNSVNSSSRRPPA